MPITDSQRTGKATIRTLLACLFFLPLAAFGQTTMSFDRISIDEGLSHSSVLAVQQDKTGFMWFATENGLDRYDGITFKNYRNLRGRQDSLPDNFARDIVTGPDGSLWVATDGGGIARWLPESDSFVSWQHDENDPASLATDRIRTIMMDPRGYLWIGTRNSGLDRLNIASGEIEHFVHSGDDPKSISNDDIYALATGHDGVVWIGTKSGLNSFDPDSRIFTRYGEESETATEASPGDSWIRSLLVDHQGVLWAGTSRGGLSRFDSASGTFRHFKHDADDNRSISSNRVEVVFEDNEKRLWIGTNRGLNLLNRETGDFRNYRNDPTDSSSLSSDGIFSIFQDNGGILWIGTRNDGLNKWNPRSWSFGHFKLTAADNVALNNPNVMSFTEDPSGKLWVATFGDGLLIVDRDKDTITRMSSDPEAPGSLSDDRVMVLTSGRDGVIWAGTMMGGLNRIDPETQAVQTFRHDESDPASLAADGVMSLLEARDGTLWVGTFGGGVSRLDAGTSQFVNYIHDPADETTLSSPRATSVAEDLNGNIWVGTDGGGLNRLDRSNNSWHRYVNEKGDPASLSTNTVYSLRVDSAGTLWVGTRAGLNRVAIDGSGEARFEVFDARDSLANDVVYSMELGTARDVWLSTARGLVRFNPGSGKVRRLHASQGLQGEEFNFGASYASASGELFFGGSNGFNAFNPNELKFNLKPPPVVLTSLSVLNKPVQTDEPYELIESIDLDYSDDVVTFEISALDFSAPAENIYAYRLLGFDDDWVDAGNGRRITYTNLDGGDYSLQVRAANGDGYWNDKGISIPVQVAFPPWATWWAYLLYALAVLVAVFGFVRNGQRKLRREAEYSRRLEQEVEQRTDELHRRNTDLKEVNEKLLLASTTDPLTGLRNRRYLFEQIGKDVDLVLRHYRDGTETLKPNGNNDLLFLMVDLDNFKPVNDSCGHEAGDELLCQIRDVLLEACRSSDDVIRWGGDEFLVVARDTNRSYAATLAERIRSGLFGRVFPVGNGQVARCTASIGYASFPFLKDQPEILQWEEVLGVADSAMYEAKKKRNSWIGIEGIDWDGTSDELYSALKLNPGKLAADGLIRAVESIEEAEQDVG